MITTKNRTFCAWMINSNVKFISFKYLLKVFFPIYDLPCKNFYYQTSWFMQPRVYLRHCGFFSYFNPVFIFTVCGMGIINTDFYFHFLQHYPLICLTYECLPAVAFPLKSYKNSLRFHSSNFFKKRIKISLIVVNQMAPICTNQPFRKLSFFSHQLSMRTESSLHSH